MKKKSKKNKGKELKVIKIKIFVVGIFSMLFLGVIIWRLAIVQLVKGEYYRAKAVSQATRDESINPNRGTIYDSKGEVLAQSIQVDSVYLNPGLVTYKIGTKVPNEIVAEGLSRIFGLDYQETLDKVSSEKSVVTIAKKVDNDKVKELKEWMNEVGITAGINIDEDTKRFYPYNNLASNLLGFCGDDNTGLYGIEERLNPILTGVSGKIETSKALTGFSVYDENEQYVPAENGNNIYLTIDSSIQQIAEKALSDAVKQNRCEDGGNVIIMNPQNGDILAMATYPDYNLNNPFSIEPLKYSEEEWKELDSEKKNLAYNNLFKNRAVSGNYEPGSTFKLIMTAIGLEEKVVDPDTPGVFYCNGAYNVADRTISCWSPEPHGSISLREALCKSCNPAFMQLGQKINAKIGLQKIYEYFEAFGFMDKVGNSTMARAYPGTFHEWSKVAAVELATTSFGENFTISPLQLVSAVSCIANGGNYIEPRIIKQVENPDTNSIEQTEVVVKRQVISEQTAETVKDMMSSVVTDGTGRHAKVEGYSIGGKSGTSEPEETNPDDGYVASFIGISPIENTQVVVLVVLYKPRGDLHQGGQTAGPVVAEIMSKILPYLGVASNSQEIESVQSETIISVPNLKDKTVAEARNILAGMGFEASIDQAVDENTTLIVDQMPKAGVALENGAKVYLYVNSGTEKVMTVVPDIRGLGVKEATNRLKEKNLNINVEGSKGVVVTQDPIAETEVAEGTVVNVTIKEQLKDTQ